MGRRERRKSFLLFHFVFSSQTQYSMHLLRRFNYDCFIFLSPFGWMHNQPHHRYQYQICIQIQFIFKTLLMHFLIVLMCIMSCLYLSGIFIINEIRKTNLKVRGKFFGSNWESIGECRTGYKLVLVPGRKQPKYSLNHNYVNIKCEIWIWMNFYWQEGGKAFSVRILGLNMYSNAKIEGNFFKNKLIMFLRKKLKKRVEKNIFINSSYFHSIFTSKTCSREHEHDVIGTSVNTLIIYTWKALKHIERVEMSRKNFIGNFCTVMSTFFIPHPFGCF